MMAYNRRAAEAEAIKTYPREMCGLLVSEGGREVFFACENRAEDDRDFVIGERDYISARQRGKVVGVVHSHIDRDAQPTDADRVGCERSGVPWHIVAIHKGVDREAPEAVGWHAFSPSGFRAPLVGRPFFHGTQDCYGLIRDFFQREVSVGLPDFERVDKWWDEPEKHGELYLDNLEAAGFVSLGADVQPRWGDVILMQYHSDRTNHGGIYLGDRPLQTEPGLRPMSGAMLHHPQPRLSDRVVYGGYWRDITRTIARHESLFTLPEASK